MKKSSILLSIILLSACTTTKDKRTYDMHVSTEPACARCAFWQNDQEVSSMECSPGSLKMTASIETTKLICSKEGYETQTRTLTISKISWKDTMQKAFIKGLSDAALDIATRSSKHGTAIKEGHWWATQNASKDPSKYTKGIHVVLEKSPSQTSLDQKPSISFQENTLSKPKAGPDTGYAERLDNILNGCCEDDL